MSFFLDPPALIILGFILAILNKKWISSQLTRILGFILILVFWVTSGLLFLDWIEWPINVFDMRPPCFESIGGKKWMLHTDIIGITDISSFLAILIFFTYPFFLWIGYEITHSIIDPHSIKIIAGKPLTVTDVKSHQKARKKNEPVLLAAARDPDPIKALHSALNLLGGLKKFIKPGDKVVIKPNICGGNPEIPGSFTSISMVEELIHLIKSEGAEILAIIDSDMVWIDFDDIAKAQGWIDWAKKNNFPLINLRKTNCVKFDFGSSSKIGVSVVSKLLIDADVIISFPTMKTHLLTNITCGMKNMYGTFPEGDKAKYHKIGIEEVIVDINWCFTPTLTIIDGSIGGEAIGPLTCKPLNYETIIVSNDVVAADALSAFMMGYDPLIDIEHIKKAHQLEIGRGDVIFDWNSFSYSHPKDGNWIKPDPLVTKFYNDTIELMLHIPTMKKFMNAASDFLLYDTATLPIFENITPVVLGVMSDIFSSVFNIWGKLKGGKKKYKIAAKIEMLKEHINKEIWPSNQLKDHLMMIGTKKNLQIDPPLQAIDITQTQPEESCELAFEFNPHVLLQGLELKSEKNANTYGGLMYRVLQNPTDSSERCIQYLYSWTHQKWFLSGWFHILIPLFLSALGIIIFSQTGIGNKEWTYASIWLVIGFLFLTGGISAFKTISEWRRSGRISYIYRHPFCLFFYGLLFFGIFYELPSRWNSKIIFPTFDILDFTVYIPLISIIFFFLPAIVIIIMIQPFFSLFTHKIDYTPVFVYIKSENQFNWSFDKVRYDKFHYDVETKNKKEAKEYLIDGKKIRLAIPNTWHSMTTTRGWGKPISILGFLGFIISYNLLFLLILFEPNIVEGMDLLALIVTFSFVFAYLFFARNQIILQKFKTTQDFKEPGKILTRDKLRILWNLSDNDSTLKTKQTFQNPFDSDRKFWNSFLDIKDQKTILEEIKAIQNRTHKIISLFIGLTFSTLVLIGFYFGGFWGYSIKQLQTPNEGFIIAFLTLFGIILVAFLIYSSKNKPSTLIILLMIAALFAWFDENIFTYVEFWKYLEGKPVSLLFVIFAWPVLLIVIIGSSNWVLKHIRLPEYKKRFGARMLNFIPIAIITCIFGLFFISEKGLSELEKKDTEMLILVCSAIILPIISSIIFGLIHSFKQNLVTITFAMTFGAIMETLGNLCGYWTYFEFIQIFPSIPNFLIVFWAFRLLTILFLGELLDQKILYSD